MVHCIYQGVTGYKFQINHISFSEDPIALVLSNSVDTDEMLRNHLGLKQSSLFAKVCLLVSRIKRVELVGH